MDVAAYSAFLKKRAKDFRQIADQTQGEMEVEDLHTEAWFAAEYHAAKRGFDIDWSDPADQKLILGTLTVKHVWKTNEERKRTISADAHAEDEDGRTSSLIEFLQTDQAPDPLELLEQREETAAARVQREKEDAILECYSQSVAYNVALWHFNNIRWKLADYLAIDRGTLRDRIDAAAKALKVQPSIFDGIVRITSSFWPAEGRAYCREIKQHLAGQQWHWDF